MSSRFRIALLALFALAAACADGPPSPTEIMLVVDSDWDELTRVTVQVEGLGDGKPVNISLADDWLPRSVALVHEGGPPGPIRVVVSGYTAGEDEPVIVEPRDEVYFERHQVRTLRVELFEVCADAATDCGDELACTLRDDEADCVLANTLSELSDWEGHDKVKVLRPDLKNGMRRDGGMDAGGDIVADGGIDAGGVDAGGLDASGIDAGGVDAGGADAGGCGGAGQPACSACSLGSGMRKPLTVAAAQLGADLSDFPLLVAFTDSDVKDAALASGADLCFADAQGVPLAFELVRYDSVSGGLEAWVRVPQLSATTDTTLYLYYGDGVATDRSNATGVWTGAYLGVYHMEDALDSSVNAHHGTLSGVGTEVGQVGTALSFDGDMSYMELTQDAFDGLFAGGATLEAWIQPDSFGESVLGRVFDKASGTAPAGGWAVFLRDDGLLASESVTFGQSFDDNSRERLCNAPDSSIVLQSWQHLAVVWDSDSPGDDALIYLDGAEVNVSGFTTGGFGTPNVPDDDSANALRIGNHAADTVRGFDGLIDEVRISTTARSADWIAAQALSQSTPGNFVQVGAEQSVP